jgi:hypothetical protein
MVLKEILLLSAAIGFFFIWGLDLYNGQPLKASYFWVMFGVACLLYFQYSKNLRLKKEEKNTNNNSDSNKIKPKKK